LPTKNIQPSTTIEVDHIKYKVEFIKEKFYKRRQCIMHSINSWKDSLCSSSGPLNAHARQESVLYIQTQRTPCKQPMWLDCLSTL
jgi:hypothetical protein